METLHIFADLMQEKLIDQATAAMMSERRFIAMNLMQGIIVVGGAPITDGGVKALVEHACRLTDELIEATK